MPFQIVVDSCCDLTPEMRGSGLYHNVPLTIYVGESAFRDDMVLDTQDLVDAMAMCQEASHTACPAPADYLSMFERCDGDLYVVTLSALLSPAGVRVGLLTGAMTADYEQVEQFTLRLTEMLSRADSATIQKDGHTLTLDLKGRRGVASTGVFRHKGNSGNLPSGEAYIAPVENGSNGSVVVDGSFGDIGLLGSPIQLTVRDGKLVDIQGQDADKLSVLRESEANATLCELGIGANYAARLRGILLEDEKAYHTIHVAFGTNDDFGGTNKATCHMDGIIKNPTLYLDDVLVMRDGEYLI